MRKSLLLSAAFGVISAGFGLMAVAQSGPAANETSVVQTYPGGIQLIEEVTRTGDEILIPYRKFRMPNGLTVILHQDTSDPLVHVDVTFHVGSGREDIGKSGFAHFFEHMLFQGSENVADEEHFKIVSESGGTLNGTTNADRTNYFETVPANQLEKMLWLEADRMGFFLDAVTQEKFEVQRETVKNERGQRVDNAPYGLRFERVGEALYPEGHPYSWSTIGYLEDLDRADLDDLKRFFLRWYGPNNAVLTIGGRFDEQETLEWVHKYFGPIPVGPVVEDPVPSPVTLDADRYISWEDRISAPLFQMTWPTVHLHHPDEAPLDVLNSILGQGRTSLLYKNLVKEGKVAQAQGFHFCQELACQFLLFGLVNPTNGTTLAEVDEIMRASFKEFETRGVTDDDLERVKASIISGQVFGLESVAGKVRQLAFYETFGGNPNYTPQEIARYEAVTKEDVMRVYETYIKDKPAVVVSIVPIGGAIAPARDDTWQRYERTIPEYPSADGLDLREAVDTFDRSIQPPASDINLSIELPELWRSELANGIDVLGAVNTETPTTAIQLKLDVGQQNETLEKLGLATLTANMLGEATEISTNEELSNRLDKLGSAIFLNAGDNTTTVTIRSLTSKLDETLAIVAERLYQPGFKDEDFQRLKAQTLQGIRNAKNQPTTTATNVYNQLLYGKNNSFAFPNTGTETTVEGIELDDVKAFYADNYSASVASIIAVTDLSQAELTEKLKIFETWAAEPVATPALQAFPDLDAGTIYLIDKEKAAQSEIRIGKRGIPYDATGDFYRSGLMNFALGGAFNSRINLNLREDKGYSYGARAFFRGEKAYGSYTAQAGVRTDSTADSIVQFFNEISGYYAGGLRDDEVTFTKSAIGQSDARRYETPFQKLSFLNNVQTYNLPDGFVDEQNAILEAASLEELNGLAQKYLNPDEMIIVVVGDKAEILESLQGLGRKIVELDADGNPV